jgi:hypothetical protein
LEISVVKISNQNKEELESFAISKYFGEKCLFCGRVYKTQDDLKDTLWVGQNENRRLACLGCWQKFGQNV